MSNENHFFTLKQNLLIRVCDFSQIYRKFKSLKAKLNFDYHFSSHSSNNDAILPSEIKADTLKIIDSKTLENDLVYMLINYKIDRIYLKDDLLKVSYLLENYTKYDSFKTILFYMYPLYSCLSLKTNILVGNFEEPFLIQLFENTDDICQLGSIENDDFITFFILSLYTYPNKHIRYKHLILNWHRLKGIALPNFTITNFNFAILKKAFYFIFIHMKLFYNDDYINLNKIPKIKACGQSYLKDNIVNATIKGKSICLEKEINEPSIKILNLAIHDIANLYIYYKSNYKFEMYIYDSVGLIENGFIDPNLNKIAIKFRNSSNLRIKIKTDNVKAALITYLKTKKTVVRQYLDETNKFSYSLKLTYFNFDSNDIILDKFVFSKCRISNLEFPNNSNSKNNKLSALTGIQYYKKTYSQPYTIVSMGFETESIQKIVNILFNCSINLKEELNSVTKGRNFYLLEITSKLLKFCDNYIEIEKLLFNFEPKSYEFEIKNYIHSCYNATVTTHIENYWILKSKLDLSNRAWMQSDNFDLIDQSEANYDNESSLSCIFANNLNLNFKNIFIMSDLMHLKIDIIKFSMSKFDETCKNFTTDLIFKCKVYESQISGMAYLFLTNKNISYMKFTNHFKIKDGDVSLNEEFKVNIIGNDQIEINKIKLDSNLKDLCILIVFVLLNEKNKNFLFTLRLSFLN
jgi:hypothetical protein